MACKGCRQLVQAGAADPVAIQAEQAQRRVLSQRCGQRGRARIANIGVGQSQAQEEAAVVLESAADKCWLPAAPMKFWLTFNRVSALLCDSRATSCAASASASKIEAQIQVSEVGEVGCEAQRHQAWSFFWFVLLSSLFEQE